MSALVENNVVFFGGYAMYIYSKYMPRNIRRNIDRIPDFDVLSDHPKEVATSVKRKLLEDGFNNVEIVEHKKETDILLVNYEVKINNNTIVFIYKPIACHSYNVIHVNGVSLRVATIDTMLSMYLAFLYIDRPYYDPTRILCMSKYLFEVENHNKLAQKGVLKRFSINCIGHQETVNEIRAEKTEKFIELKNKQNSPEYEEWFLRYRPTSSTTSATTSLKSNAPTKTQTKRAKKTSSKTKTFKKSNKTKRAKEIKRVKEIKKGAKDKKKQQG